MSIDMWWVFLPACFAINMSPGPNNLLVMQSATTAGFKLSALAASGRILAFSALIIGVSAGLSSILLLAPWFLTAVKTVGGLYLLWISQSLWRAEPQKPAQDATVFVTLAAAFRREFGVALSNPKAILVFSAFLPQFVSPDGNAFGQLMWLGLAFLVLECVAIGFYALLGSHFRAFLATANRRRLFNRFCGILLGVAGLTLLLTDFH